MRDKNFLCQIPWRITVLCFQNYWTIPPEVSFHWFTFVISCICWLILSRITLLIFAILYQTAWNFIWKGLVVVLYCYICFCFLQFFSPSDMGSLFVILSEWLFTLFTFRWLDFLYVFVIFSFSSFLYPLWPNLYSHRDLSAEKNTLSLFFICFMSLLRFSWKLLFTFLNLIFLSLVTDHFRNLIVFS